MAGQQLKAYVLLISTCWMLNACSKPASEIKHEDVKTNVTLEDIGPASTTMLAGHDGGKDKSVQPNILHPQLNNQAQNTPQIAYDYDYSFFGKSDTIEQLMMVHKNTCLAAGPIQCQLISSQVTRMDDGQSGMRHLTLRASSEWIKSFQTALTSNLKRLDITITSENITSEDLSASIVDMQARLDNKLALRNQLRATLAGHSGKMSELVDLESKLSEVQSDLDSNTAQMDMLKQRVAMSKLDLIYDTKAGMGARSAMAPVNSAIESFVPNMAMAIGFIISALSVLIPIGLIIGPITWVLVKRFKLRKMKSENKRSKDA